MTRNQWLERHKAEREVIKNHLETFLLFAWHCFQTDGTKPTDYDAEQVLNEAAKCIQEELDEL
jgi:hypothetical protein